MQNGLRAGLWMGVSAAGRVTPSLPAAPSQLQEYHSIDLGKLKKKSVLRQVGEIQKAR